MDRRDKLIDAGMVLASELDLDVILQRIVELAVELTDARYGALGVIGPDGRIIDFITTGVTPGERAAIGDPPTGHGILGLLIREAHPLRLDDIAAHPSSVGFPPNHPPMKTFLGAPLRARDQVFGNIYLTESQGAGGFDEEDERTLVVLAAQAGIAVENARLHEEVQGLVVLEDRERIAKELHDGAIQSLFAVGMGLQGAAALSMDSDLERRIEDAVEAIDGVIRDLRNYIFGLRPGILADRQLDEVLRRLARDFQERTGVTTVVEIDGTVAAELTGRAADVVQMAREALSNVERHAKATTCRVSLNRDRAGALLEIDDDGGGFDAGGADPSGQGLLNLRARAEALGGGTDIESSLGEGTTARIRIPL